MQGFSTIKLKVETSDGHNFTLIEDYTYERKDGCVITVPAGTASDGASVPRFLWREIPPFGSYFKSAFLHDFLYRETGVMKDYADETLLEAMLYDGVPEVEARLIYEAVEHFGGGSFTGDRKEFMDHFNGSVA
jgi:hypothetical protein